MSDKLVRVHVENFKSLKNFDIKFNKFNVLIGPNGSGKTNVLELFKFVNLCINPTQILVTNPFAFWSGYKNIVWSGDKDLPISLQISYVIKNHNITYETFITGSDNGRLAILKESLFIKNYLSITHDYNEFDYKFDKNYIKEISSINKNLFSRSIMRTNFNNLAKGFTLFSDDDNVSILKQPSWNVRHFPNLKLSLLLTNVFDKDDVNPIILPSPTINIDDKHIPLYKLAIGYLVSTNHIILLKQLNYKQLRNSTHINYSINLNEDGNGLINLLYQWYSKFQQLPEIFELALKELFPNWQIHFIVTEKDNITLGVDDNGINLSPSSIPEGFYKLLAILAAIELNPKILLIDEMDASLHASIIEYVIGLLKNCDATVIITTHSPIIVDSVDLEDLVMIKKENHESVCSRIDNAGELRQELHDKGITVSETWLYGEL